MVVEELQADPQHHCPLSLLLEAPLGLVLMTLLRHTRGYLLQGPRLLYLPSHPPDTAMEKAEDITTDPKVGLHLIISLS